VVVNFKRCSALKGIREGYAAQLLTGGRYPAKGAVVIVSSMSKLEAFEKNLSGLSAEELAEFWRWFAEFDGAAWDSQIERDVKAGKLDALAAEALCDQARGKIHRVLKHFASPNFWSCYRGRRSRSDIYSCCPAVESRGLNQG
jgi:hypothetical protein